MKTSPSITTGNYETALVHFMENGAEFPPASHRGMHADALDSGLALLAMANRHEKIVADHLRKDVTSSTQKALVKRAASFFAHAILPEQAASAAKNQAGNLKQAMKDLASRTEALARMNQKLRAEVGHRESLETELTSSHLHYRKILEKSEGLQDQLRRLSRQLLTSQEDERLKISRELHDVIAQTLTGINIRLATLQQQSILNGKSLTRKIQSTRRLVEKSVMIVHQFACELRPAVIDDLGLVPALQGLVRKFSGRTHIRASLRSYTEVDDLDTTLRTVLFRVAEEALKNIARHSGASVVIISIKKTANGVVMKIKDDGKSFNVSSVLKNSKGKRLGLLGMRERVEMVNGFFTVVSAPGEGTTIIADIPMPGRDKHALPDKPHGEPVIL